MTISPVQRIHTYQNEFTKTETELMEYILTNLHTVATNSIDHVAEDSGISKSAFVRFATLCSKRWLMVIFILYQNDLVRIA